MSDLSFGRPLWLLLAPLALALLPLAWLVARRALRDLLALTREPPRPRWRVMALVVVAVALAAVAAALPRWSERSATLQSDGAQFVAVLDVSRSMGAGDIAPSRLAASREALAETFARLRGDRVALVLFAGDARLRFPLTRDLAAAATVLETVEGGTLLLGRGTSAASGLALARDLFDDESAGGRLVLLLSDGEDLGADPAASAAALAAAGIDLLVAGVGTAEGAVVPVRDPFSGEVDALARADGSPVVTRLNEERLRAIAAAGGGRYLGANPSAIPAAVRSRLAGLEQVTYGAATLSLPVERFQWFAAAALALLLLATALEWRTLARWRRAPAIAAAVVVAGALAGCATAAYTLNERALRQVEAGDLTAAVELLYDARAEAPRDSRIALNLASVLHAAGRYEEAARVARRALNDRDPAIATAAHASLGHHLFALGELEEALEAFREGLLLDPLDDVMRRDYEVVYRLLHPPPPPDEREAPAERSEDEEGDDSEPDGAPRPAPDGAAGAPGEGDGEDGRQGLSPAALEERLAAIDAEIAELRAEAGEVLSAREALAILERLEERNRIAAQNPVRGVWSDASDY